MCEGGEAFRLKGDRDRAPRTYMSSVQVDDRGAWDNKPNTRFIAHNEQISGLILEVQVFPDKSHGR